MRTRMKRRSALLLAALTLAGIMSSEAYALPCVPAELIPSGAAVGIMFDTDGIIVSALEKVDTEAGMESPAADSGIVPGDIIKNIGQTAIRSMEDLRAAMRENSGEEVSVRVERAGRTLQFTVVPAKSRDGKYELGLWLRDGITGIGTVTFIDPATGACGVLGHAINDAETGVELPLRSGALVALTPARPVKGRKGAPGQLQGSLDREKELGRLAVNTSFGVFGTVSGPELRGGDAIPVARQDEIKTGAAAILSDVGDGVEMYSVQISRVYSAGSEHSMLLTVSDPRLIEKTGGIVQGMSGSPIIQNGRLVGAVTHVLIADPCKGYGISVERMLGAAAELDSAA